MSVISRCYIINYLRSAIKGDKFILTAIYHVPIPSGIILLKQHQIYLDSMIKFMHALSVCQRTFTALLSRVMVLTMKVS